MELIFNGQAVEYSNETSVLDCLLNSGYDIPHSCKSGTCQSCVLQAVEGVPCSNAQEGLKENLKEQGWFKSCVCFPSEPLNISTSGVTDKITVIVSFKKMLDDRTLLLRLVPEEDLEAIKNESRSSQLQSVFNSLRLEYGLDDKYSVNTIIANQTS